MLSKDIKVPNNEIVINPLYCVSLPSYTYPCGLENTDNKLQTLHDKDMIPLLEKKFLGDIRNVMGSRNVKPDGNKRFCM